MFLGRGKQKPPGMNDSDPYMYSSQERRGVSISSSAVSRKSKANWKRHYKARREAKREAKVVQKSAEHVDKIVSCLTDGLPFLMNTPNLPIAKFQRSEIVVGNLLGRGVFARVYEVKDLDLHDDEEYLEPLRGSTMSEPFASNVQDALDEAHDMIMLDDSSSSEHEAPSTLDAQLFGTSLDQQPLGELDVIAEDENDEAQGQRQQQASSVSGSDQHGDDSTTTGTSSTAPASAPPTPPLTPASQTMEPPETGRRQTGRLRSSTANYQHQLMNSSCWQNDQSSLRLRARDMVRSGDKGYALKHLTKTLLRNPKDFHLAAAALLVEAKYLAKLNHPNIIKVTGLAMSGGSVNGPGFSESTPQKGSDHIPDHSRRRNEVADKEGLEGGQYDSYFLITERLTDTLDRRIRQWKRDQPTHKNLSEQSSTQKIQTWKHMMRKTSYALQISNALAYLHERRLLYRDLKPQNIGFIGDNQTICIFNFGLCRELKPSTGTIKEDPITALFGALSWKYTAVECFPQPIVQTPGDFLTQSARLFHSPSSKSFGLDSLSNSLRGLKPGRSSHSAAMEELQRELQVVQEQYKEELSESAQNAATAAPSSGKLSKKQEEMRKTMTTPEYDIKADVYSWAMVYYEMLTTNQPFSGMTQKEHLRKVARSKGGQRPGVYQFNLTPSMISLLQRAWDQNPKKRPTMDSVGRNLQLILKELEQLIIEEQKTLLKAAGGTEESVAALTTKEERAARRAKRIEEKEKQLKNKRRRRVARKSSMVNILRRTSDGVFARNRYRRGDVRESIMDAPTGLLGPLPKLIPGLETTLMATNGNMDRASTMEVDVDALEYEVWSSDDEHDDLDSAAPFQSESFEASSLTSHLNTVVTIDNNAKDATNVDLDGAASDDEGNNPEPSNTENGEDKDVVGDAILAMRNRRRGSKPLPSRDRNLTNESRSRRVNRARRKTKSESIKSHRTFFDPLALQRSGTNRMSRRTMRLSRASVWMMRRDVKVFVFTMAVLVTLVFCGSGWFWYKKRQATWLGVNLDELGQNNNETESRRILRLVMTEECRLEVSAKHDTSAPMLFMGGALSPVDLECMEHLERVLQEKMIRVTGFDPSKVEVREVGFLGVKHFAKPPPQPKPSRWRRKKAWKFFREPAPLTKNDNTNRLVPLAGSQARTTNTTAGPQTSSAGPEASREEDSSPKSEPANGVSSPENAKKTGRRNARAFQIFRDNPDKGTAEEQDIHEAGLFGFLTATETADSDATTTAEP